MSFNESMFETASVREKSNTRRFNHLKPNTTPKSSNKKVATPKMYRDGYEVERYVPDRTNKIVRHVAEVQVEKKKKKHMEGSSVHRLKYPGKTFPLERIVLVRADTREVHRTETLNRLGLKISESIYFQVEKLRIC